MTPTLVVLAAGLGSRFGGAKQLAPLGPGGATLLEYALFDAARAGFGRALLLTSGTLEADVRALADARLRRHLPVDIALQEMTAAGAPAPPGRTAPWGTAHAVLAVAPRVDGQFAVINADDFYGADAYALLASGLAADPASDAVVGYRLGDTLSAEGGVNRGVIVAGPDGRLEDIEEVLDLEQADGLRAVGRAPSGPRFVPLDTLVSMNMWGFGAGIAEVLAEEFTQWLADADPMRDEYPLPSAMRRAVRRHGRTVRVLGPASGWLGVTHAGDADQARRALAARRHAYPADF